MSKVIKKLSLSRETVLSLGVKSQVRTGAGTYTLEPTCRLGTDQTNNGQVVSQVGDSKIHKTSGFASGGQTVAASAPNQSI